MASFDWKRQLLFPVFVCVVICGCFAYFYSRARSKAGVVPLILTDAVIGRSIPDGELTDVNHKRIDPGVMKHGKVILVLLSSGCFACTQEVNFLKTVVHQNPHVQFYGLLLYSGKSPKTPR